MSDHRHDPFARTGTALPRTMSREGRVELLAEVADDLLAGRRPDRTAAAWLGSAITAWLLSSKPSKAADLVRDFLEIAPPARSKATPQRIAAQIWRQKARAARSADSDASHPDPDEQP